MNELRARFAITQKKKHQATRANINQQRQRKRQHRQTTNVARSQPARHDRTYRPIQTPQEVTSPRTQFGGGGRIDETPNHQPTHTHPPKQPPSTQANRDNG